MSETHASPSRRHEAGQYEIRLQGHLDARWAAWFDGLTLTREGDGTTLIRGQVVDQAALHGLLQSLRDLGITLLSLIPLTADGAVEQPHDSPNQTHHHAPGATS